VTELGTVRRDGDGGAVRFERVYGAPPEDLWDAWTAPERIKRWLGADVSGGPVGSGASFVLEWGADDASKSWVDVLAHEPPRLLEWSWTVVGEKPSTLRVELTPVEGGTLLVLDHRGLAPSQFPGVSAGWHDFLDVLGSGVPSDEDRWQVLLPAYKEKVSAL
jgi:uncharacterized protein YndB with AHSA1/START domain